SLDGWPIEIGQNYPPSSLAIGDIDNDGSVEIVGRFYENTAALAAFEIDGSLAVVYNPSVNSAFISSPVLMDIDNDSDLEVFARSDQYLYGFHHDGFEVNGFPQNLNDAQSSATFNTPLALGDLDRDGDPEIVAGFSSNFGNGGGIIAYHHDGAIVAGFPVLVEASVSAAPIVADVEDDSRQEIIFPASDGRLHVVDYLGIS
ncbi:MAG: VCBS repeat-containing protein, partial [Planctomycetes bacterium]|nr:VCBS repeat-containing protein [Planctomycetota bacterium]